MSIPSRSGVYRKAVVQFVAFCDEEGLEPEFLEEFDDLLVEWKRFTRSGQNGL